jgi:methionyl-tRNA formyltransferase
MGTPISPFRRWMLVAAGHDVVAAYSQPPRPGGRRGRELTPSRCGRRVGIEVRHPVSLKARRNRPISPRLNADVAVVAAYGLILPRAVLAAPAWVPQPAWLAPAAVARRGAGRAILAGDAETGVGIMQMEAGWTPARFALKGARRLRARPPAN